MVHKRRATAMLDEMLHPNATTVVAIVRRARNVARACHIYTGAHHQRDRMSSRFGLSDHSSEGLQIFKHFQTSGSDPDEFSLSKLLSIAAKLNAFDEGKQIHAFVVKKNVPMDVPASNSLISFYIKCGSLGDAEIMFDCMPERDVYTWTVVVSGYALNGRMEKAMDLFYRMPCRNTVSWNSMISACQSKGNDEMALKLFGRMRREGEVPNELTYVTALKACTSLQALERGEGVHCSLIKSAWMKNILVACTLMDVYAKCGDLFDVQKVFSEITDHNVVSWSILLAAYAHNGRIKEAERIFSRMPGKNVISWNVMIDGYVRNEMQDRAFSVFMDMIEDGMQPNCFTLTSILSGCAMPHYAENGKLFHAYIVKIGLQSDTSVGNSLITMYGEQRNVGDARLVFDTMPQHDVVSWTAMVAAYVSDNNIDEARLIFDRMPGKNLISWNTMMFGFLQNGRNMELTGLNRMRNLSFPVEDALKFYYDMEKSEIKPDHFSYNCSLTACAYIGASEQARAIHCKAIKRGFGSDIGVANALINVYGKCGCVIEAEIIFNSIIKPDMISWNALLTAYSQNGQGNDVLEFYEKMKKSGVEPNHITFINLLSACSYVGEVKKGKEYFATMEKDYGISPSKEHYACMVDLLGRAGHLHEAEAIIRSMPVEPDAAVWGALLGACKIHQETVIGRRAADQVLYLDPNNSSAYVALAETFAATRTWKDAAEVRAEMKEKKLLKEPGCSWIEIRNEKHTFLSGDSSHPREVYIHVMLSSLYPNILQEGNIQDFELLAISYTKMATNTSTLVSWKELNITS